MVRWGSPETPSQVTTNKNENDLKEVDRNKIGDRDSLVIPR